MLLAFLSAAFAAVGALFLLSSEDNLIKWACFSVCIIFLALAIWLAFSSKKARDAEAEAVWFDSIDQIGVQSDEEKFNQMELMDDAQFVVYCASLYGHNGATVRQPTQFGGPDLIVTRDDETLAVFCKKSQKLISANVIAEVCSQNVVGAKSVVVSNGYFSEDARKLAKQSGVTLRDGADVVSGKL